MKKSTSLVAILLWAILASCNKYSANTSQSVNAVIGDISFVETFGELPTKTCDEKTKLQTHLRYVEKLLRNKDLSSLPIEQREMRLKMLDLLHEYWTAGVFPTNYDYPNQRIPCFIDKDGHICAVGYLIEQTIGRSVAEEINRKYKYHYLLTINDPTIESWVQSSGLTKEECAMIQPTYDYFPPRVPIPTDTYSNRYGVSSSIAIGVNLSLNTINAIQIAKGADSKLIPILGIITGAGQLTLGLLNYPEMTVFTNDIYLGSIPVVNESKRNLSLINIGVGTSTIILSTWNLITHKKPEEKSISWNIHGFPTVANDLGIGFSVSKRL